MNSTNPPGQAPRALAPSDSTSNTLLGKQESSSVVRAHSRGRRKERSGSEAHILAAVPISEVNNAGALTPKPMRIENEMAVEAKRLQEDRTGGSSAHDSRQSQSSGEDLFLNLAKADGDMDGAADEGPARRRVSLRPLRHHVRCDLCICERICLPDNGAPLECSLI